jgi:hypothetical protein
MFGLSTLVTRIIIGLAVIALVLGVFQVRSCQHARQKAAESRLQREETKAVVESAKDAIATQARSQANERASEAMTQDNEKDIRNAQGAADPVNPAARDAGIAALCRRAAYRDSPRCRSVPK